MRKFTLLFAFLVTVYFTAFSQANFQLDENKDYTEYPYWIEMMQNSEVNFYASVEAFNRYWENREITKGSGFKQFKRWEYFWETRIHPDGSFPEANEVFDAYFEFLDNTGSREDAFTGDWTNLGPIDLPDNAGTGQPSGNGRLNAIAFHPTDADIIYVGAASGGLWVTTDGGESWETHTDNLPTLGVSSIIVDHTNPMIVYIGTGDRDNSDADGMGVMKSSDGGMTFNIVNSGMGNATVGMMLMHPTDNSTLLAATSAGIFKSTNSGVNWQQTRGGDFKDIEYKADDPTVVFASATGSFYRSADGGDSWTKIDGGISGSSRGVIGVSPADSDVVYFHTTAGGAYNATYRSEDAGLTFTETVNSPNIMAYGCNGGNGGIGWYAITIAVDPANVEEVYAGTVNIWKSVNGTSSWNINSHWVGDCGVPVVHADCHALEYNPLDGRLYAGHDGGIHWTDNGGDTWNEISSGLAISQIYKMSQAKTDVNKVMNGYQDNGSGVYLGEDVGFLTVMGGDGMDNAYDHIDPRYSYGEYYYGAGITRLFNNIQEANIGNGISEQGAWVTPLDLDVVDPEIMYVGMQNLWKGTNIKSNSVTWEKVTNFTSGSNAKAIEQSEADPNIYYFSTYNTGFFRCDNLMSEDPTWTDISTFVPTSGIISDIETHPTNPNIVYITITQRVYQSEDKGVNWTNITGNLPDVSMNTIEYYKNAENGLYVGSDAGIYYKDITMNEWLLFSTGFPVSATVSEIEIFYDTINTAEDKVRAATYGRGLWSSRAAYSAPVADFMASETQIPTGCSIDFNDLSNGTPTEWSWTFEGATPASSMEENPEAIVYSAPGIYTVSLTVSNTAGEDTKTITEYITVSDDMVPMVEFFTSDSVFCAPGISQFIDESEGCPTAWLWEISPDSFEFIDGTDMNSPNPMVQFNESVSYNVKLTVTNTAGTNELEKENYVQSGGYLLPFLETFENATLDASSGWTVENPDGEQTWQLYQVGGTEPGSMSAGMDFSEYQAIGERDRLISPVNLEGSNSAWLSFEHAYAKRWEQYTDSLIIYISEDCGSSWTRIFATGEDGTGNFATHELTEDFWPEVAEDWCSSGWGASCFSFNLAEWLGQPDIRIAFETYSNFGNPLLLDNIMISATVGEYEIKASSEENLTIYPNPANNLINIAFPPGNNISEVKLVNHLGQLVYKTKVSPKAKSVQIKRQKNWAEGVYYIKVSGSKSFVQKLIINQ